MENSYSSVKTVADLKKVCTLTTAQSEALIKFLTSYNHVGNVEIKLGDIILQLSLRGQLSEEELLVEKEIFLGRVDILSETIWSKAVQTFLLKDWEGSESTLSYGELRHQMLQMARGYLSKAKSSKAEEKAAYRKVANRLQQKEEVREMLAFLGKIRSISTNTFEILRGQGGRIRLAFLVEKR